MFLFEREKIYKRKSVITWSSVLAAYQRSPSSDLCTALLIITLTIDFIMEENTSQAALLAYTRSTAEATILGYLLVACISLLFFCKCFMGNIVK